MAKRFFARAVIVSLIVMGLSLGCDKSSVTRLSVAGPSVAEPSPTPPSAPAITSVAPAEGLADLAMTVRIVGTGFRPGATVRLDDAATNVNVVSSALIIATTPIHAAGTVDVVVTNATGESSRLTAGYTYGVVALTVGPNVIAPGAQLTVSWVAPGRSNYSDGDWVGLFRAGDQNTNRVWEYYTTGATGTVTLNAPLQPGVYEFRYLVNDGFIDVARSSPVTITAGGD